MNADIKAQSIAKGGEAPVAGDVAGETADENVETPTLSPQAIAELTEDVPKNVSSVNVTKNATIVKKNETADEEEAPVTPLLPIQASVSNAYGAQNVTFDDDAAKLLADGNLDTGLKFAAAYLPANFEFTFLKEETITNLAIATYDDLSVPENCIVEKWTGTEWEPVIEAKYANKGSNTMKISGMNSLGKLFRIRFEAITLRQTNLRVGLREVTFQSGGEVVAVVKKQVAAVSECKFSVGDTVYNRYAGGSVWAKAEVKSVKPACDYKIHFLEDVIDDAVVKECMVKTNGKVFRLMGGRQLC
jgi:hypothetical protein